MNKKTIVFDFDGVIHKGYKGWKDGSIYGEIDYGLLWYIKDLMKDYYVVISSNRPAEQIVNFLNNDANNPLDFEVFKKDMQGNMYWNKDNVVGVTNEKAVGIIYIDDRGYRYKDLKDLKTNLGDNKNEYFDKDFVIDKKELATLLNLIQRQDTEINKLNNVIDRMVKHIVEQTYKDLEACEFEEKLKNEKPYIYTINGEEVTREELIKYLFEHTGDHIPRID